MFWLLYQMAKNLWTMAFNVDQNSCIPMYHQIGDVCNKLFRGGYDNAETSNKQ